MASRSGLDRARLTGGGGNRGTVFVVAAVVVFVVIGGVWFFLIGGDEEPVLSGSTTSSSTTLEPSTTTTEETTSTTVGQPTQTTTLAAVVTEIPVLTEQEAYNGAQSRLQWLLGNSTGWIVDLETGSAGRFTDVPPGPRGEGAAVRDGSLVVEVNGRILRRTNDGTWTDISPAADRSYRIVDTRTGDDHLHLYLVEYGGPVDRLMNVMLRYEEPEILDEKWVADGTGVVRVSASKSAQLVIVELAPQGDEPPGYLLLSEASGRLTRRGSFPTTDPPTRYVWGLEFLEGADVFYMQCTDAQSFSACGASDGEIVSLSTGAVTAARDRFPGWSVEWETLGDVPSVSRAFKDRVLLVRTNVDLANLVNGDRERLILAREL